MPGAKWALGPEISAPKEFYAHRRFADAKYIYRVDSRRGIIKRSPKFWSNKEESVYFAVVRAGAGTKEKKISKVSLSRPLQAAFATTFMAGFLLLIYPFYPAAEYQLKQTAAEISNPQPTVAATVTESKTNALYIPKIGVNAPILEAPSLEILNIKEGVWHQTGTTNNNLVIAGHRWKYRPPNTSTFYNLHQLKPGDEIYLDWHGKRISYIVRTLKEVDQKQTEILNPSPTAKLTLYTCLDLKETKRLVIEADIK